MNTPSLIEKLLLILLGSLVLFLSFFFSLIIGFRFSNPLGLEMQADWRPMFVISLALFLSVGSFFVIRAVSAQMFWKRATALIPAILLTMAVGVVFFVLYFMTRSMDFV